MKKQVYEKIILGQSIMCLGGAGTGKSTMITELYSDLKTTFKENEIGVTATTGTAAIKIGGSTFHSFLGIGIKKTFADIKREVFKRKKHDVWRSLRVLFIDEISMLDGDFFTELEKAARYIRNKELFFGGIQLVLFGDFFQLPPVPDIVDKDKKKRRKTFKKKDVKYLFESDVLMKNISVIVELTKIHRQTDKVFIKLLNHIKKCKVTIEDEKMLRECCRKLDTSDGIEPTILYPINVDVDKYNREELAKLKGQKHVFKSKNSYGYKYDKDVEHVKPINTDEVFGEKLMKFLDGGIIPKELELKVGAQVMYLKNDSINGLVNGSRGVVTKIKYNDKDHPIIFVRFVGKKEDIEIVKQVYDTEIKSDKIVLFRQQIPLKLAWALTIHKCQGMTLDKAKVSTKRIFTYGQFYVALSRVRSLAGLELMDLHLENIKTDPRVLEFYKNLRLSGKKRKAEEQQTLQDAKKRKKL